MTGNNKGMTMVELMVALGILGLLIALAIPNVMVWIDNNRLKGVARDLMSDLQRAKMEAAKRNVLCTVTFNQQVGGQNFDYLVYADADEDLEYDAGEEILHRVNFPNRVAFDTTQGGGDGLTFQDNDEGLPSIAFTPRGLPQDNAGGLGMGSGSFINNRNQNRRVVVSSAGRIRIESY